MIDRAGYDRDSSPLLFATAAGLLLHVLLAEAFGSSARPAVRSWAATGRITAPPPSLLHQKSAPPTSCAPPATGPAGAALLPQPFGVRAVPADRQGQPDELPLGIRELPTRHDQCPAGFHPHEEGDTHA
ncbi:hypothetical protein [Kitasatospora sp. NPDC056731]|uniref:hypothetical protein n=1 Tax=Kitasatospora sp. NPDC056731 TaxID=3155422 RepID=UPI003427FB95